jgi:hypothetical protein
MIGVQKSRDDGIKASKLSQLWRKLAILRYSCVVLPDAASILEVSLNIFSFLLAKLVRCFNGFSVF